MSAIRELDQVELTAPLPSDRLVAGDVGTIVLVHREGEAFEVEFLTFGGETIAVTTVLASQVRPITNRDITHTRLVESRL